MPNNWLLIVLIPLLLLEGIAKGLGVEVGEVLIPNIVYDLTAWVLNTFLSRQTVSCI